MSAIIRLAKRVGAGGAFLVFSMTVFGQSNNIVVSALPASAGMASGGGTFATDSTNTVTAAANNGYSFVDWTEGTNVVSTSNSYTFVLTNDVTDLVANFSQNPLITQGGEFSVIGARSGDQVLPSISLSSSGGVIVWQDNWIDKKGGGIGMSLLNTSLASSQPIRVNKVVTGLQNNPAVQLLPNGNIISVWQGSATLAGRPFIYARFVKNTGGGSPGFYTGDIQVNTFTADQQANPAVAALPDGSAIIAWQSYGENGPGTYWGVYARRLSAAGKPIKSAINNSTKQFLVTQYTSYNQRNPVVATLAGGNYVIAWVSEQERGLNRVDIYARIFSPDGSPVTDEIAVNSGADICDTPALAPNGDGGFTVVWAQKDAANPTNSWDVWGRAFSSSGSPEVNDFTVNTYLYGDQDAPKIASGSAGSMVVWTSQAEDGSGPGVFGRYLAGGNQPSGPEFQVNTTYISEQIQPDVAWDGNRFVAVWTSFVGASGFDLYGQAYVLNSSP